MRKLKGLGMLLLAGTMIMAMVGCAKPPVEEKQAAEAAKNNALTAQAEVYAAGAVTEAQKLWDDAEAKMKNRAYKEAKLAYTAAKASYDVAVGQVDAGKKAMVAENDAAAKAVEASWNELSKSSVKKVKNLEAALKPTWEAESKKIQDALAKAKDTNAKPADVKQALEEAKTLVEKWLGIFKK
jgi:uncharacterized lipoprotein YehR (DUF1307 family)